ncbi:hypothetical protein KAS31_04155 [Candidatus Parcubacteria bacterium]|nr:hypothetical protein [Candidatus Parcubacteria bacterium]
MKKIKVITLGIVAIIILIILLPSILNLFTKDIESFDDSDLKLYIIEINDEENGYFDLIKIKDVIYNPEGKEKEVRYMAENKVWDQALADEIINNNREAFELFSNAAKKPKYQYPLLANPENININMELPPLNTWRVMSYYSVIKSLNLSKQGRDKEAIEEALNSVYIGQKIQESQVSAIEYLVAIALKENGLETIKEIIKTSSLSNNELTDYAKILDLFYNNEKGLVSVIKGEYQTQANIIDTFTNKDIKELVYLLEENEINKYPSELKNSYHFRPNKTKLMFANYAREEIENVDKFCKDVNKINIQRKVSDSYIKSYFTENIIGNILYDVVANSLSGINIKKCNEDSLISITKIFIALKSYKNDNGDLPRSLNQLVPAYLESVPLDYFDGNQLRYSKENRILYSVGEDGKDEGGSTGEDWKKMSDPTFNISF